MALSNQSAILESGSGVANLYPLPDIAGSHLEKVRRGRPVGSGVDGHGWVDAGGNRRAANASLVSVPLRMRNGRSGDREFSERLLCRTARPGTLGLRIVHPVWSLYAGMGCPCVPAAGSAFALTTHLAAILHQRNYSRPRDTRLHSALG